MNKQLALAMRMKVRLYIRRFVMSPATEPKSATPPVTPMPIWVRKNWSTASSAATPQSILTKRKNSACLPCRSSPVKIAVSKAVAG
ncbi:hypothetical protein EHS17_02610 [Rhodobacteraceae bacterium CH30]|nr:hypothetical protein EHS17_02610 [Rhodobacteraceae bacterium CH30]